MPVPKDCPGITVDGELFVRLSDAAKLREGWDKADERIRELTLVANQHEHEALTAKSTLTYMKWLLQDSRALLLQSHDTIFRLMDNQDLTARELVTKIRLWLSKDFGE
jgi:hypothetical protein